MEFPFEIFIRFNKKVSLQRQSALVDRELGAGVKFVYRHRQNVAAAKFYVSQTIF